MVRVGLIWGLTVCCVSPRSGDDLPNGLAAVRNRHGAARGVAQVACNLWGPQAVEALHVLRWVALVAALGYRGGGPTEVSQQRSITTRLLCQGTPVGSQASQPVTPRLTPLACCIVPWHIYSSILRPQRILRDFNGINVIRE